MTAIFEFSSGILVIVVGLAITHLVAGLGSIIRYRRHLEVDWLPIVWMVVLLLVLVGWCYAIWDILHEVESLEFTHFLVFILASTLFYLPTSLKKSVCDAADQRLPPVGSWHKAAASLRIISSPSDAEADISPSMSWASRLCRL